MTGEIPNPINPPPGCPFHPRDPQAVDLCKAEIPAPRAIVTGSAARHLV